MRASARSSSIVILSALVGVLITIAGACQKSGDALLFVTVTASPALLGVDTVDVTVTKVADAAPRTAGPLHYPCPDGGVEIGASGETLTVVVPGSAGPVTLTVVARDAGGQELSRGTSSPVDPHAGSITNVTVTLGSSNQSDAGTSDGAADGGTGASGAGGSATGVGGTGGGAGAAGGTSGTAGTTGAGGAAGSGGRAARREAARPARAARRPARAARPAPRARVIARRATTTTATGSPTTRKLLIASVLRTTLPELVPRD